MTHAEMIDMLDCARVDVWHHKRQIEAILRDREDRLTPIERHTLEKVWDKLVEADTYLGCIIEGSAE